MREFFPPQFKYRVPRNHRRRVGTVVTAQDIVLALKGTWKETTGTGMCRCPAHDDRLTSLTVTKSRFGEILLHCLAGCSRSSIVEALMRLGLWQEISWGLVPHLREPVEIEETGDDPVEQTKLARSIWLRAKPLAGSIGETYLQSCGIAHMPPCGLRFMPSLKHPPSGRSLPALIAGVQDLNRNVMAIQGIYLRSDGASKDDIDSFELSLGRLGTGAVQLYPANRDWIGLTTRIEIALSVAARFALPTWATLEAVRLGKVKLPWNVRYVTIFADAGETGLRAAEEAAASYEKRYYLTDIKAPEEGHSTEVLR